MEYINNIKILFKAIFKRFKTLLPVFNIYTLPTLSSLNNRLEQKSIINIMLTKIIKNIKKWIKNMTQKIQKFWNVLRVQIVNHLTKMKKFANVKLMKKKIDKFFLKDDIK